MFINPLYANDGYTRHKYMRKLKRMTCIDVNDDVRPLAGRPAALCAVNTFCGYLNHFAV
jgi:hypothetical protein